MNPVTNTTPHQPIDRDIPDLTVGKKKNNLTRLITAGVLLLAIIVVVVGLSMFMKQLEKNKRESVAEKAKARPKAAALTSLATTDIRAAQARIEKQEQAQEAAAQAAATPTARGDAGNLAMPADAIGVTPTGARAADWTGQGQGPAYAAHGAAPTGGAAAPVMTRAQRQMDGDVLVTTSGGGASALGDDGSRLAASPSGSGLTGAVRMAAAGALDAPRNGLDDKVKPSALAAGKAGQRPDLSMLLHRGTSIPCGAITAIVSEQSGMVSCVVSNDVYSSDGKVLLIERGSKAFGERREALMQGQTRIAAIWSRIDTPYGVFVDVNSIATDPLGRAGIPAEVDNHLRERFGGAVLLSLIGDFGQSLANRANNSGGTIRFSDTSTAGQDLASKTLEHTINIPPTGYVNQGAATTILVLRDMDFRGVYELAHK